MSDNALIRALRSFGQGASNAVASNVSAPVDGLAWLLRKGGLPIPQNPVGGSDWMAQKGLTATPQNRIAGLLGETAGMVGPAVVQAAAPKIAGGLLALDDKAMDMARQGIERRMVGGGMIQPATVWHGSPHKFDKFDSSKIGTGEGAQAYGHGLYLAESDTVARHYKNAGADPSTFTPVRSIRDPAQMAATVLDRAGGDIRHATAVLTQNMQSGDSVAGAALQMLKQRAALPESKYAGNMYKVDLPDNAIARMLDWDKRLDQQAPEVRDALKSLIKQPGALDVETLAYMAKNNQNPLGKSLYTELQLSGDMNAGQRRASELLRQAGIPGIRYLDGGSRGAGQGSSNFVVFPGQEDILKILERNGVPIK